MSVANKTVIVTGGAQGIGMAVTMAFARQDATVFIADLDEDAGNELARTLTKEACRVHAVRTDVSDEKSVQHLVAQVLKAAPAIDVLINNAGVGGGGGTLRDRPTELWNYVLAVNLTGPYLCAKHVIPHMPPGSAIVNISSTRALMSEANTEPYSASKGGLQALTHSLAVSLAEQRIRVNAVCPGWIDVSDWKKEAARAPAALSDRDHAQHPVGRVGTPDDVAQACLFLADAERAGFITGTSLVVDGGMTVKMIYD